MTHSEKRLYLIKELLSELPQYRDMNISDNAEEQKRLLRSLMNIRSPRPIGLEFLKVQDECLSEEVKAKGITDSDTLPVSPVNNRLVLWRGDIPITQIAVARNQKRITAKEKPAENEKYAFRCFLLRLGFIGTEYKGERKILLKNLSGSSAFKNGERKEAASNEVSE